MWKVEADQLNRYSDQGARWTVWSLNPCAGTIFCVLRTVQKALGGPSSLTFNANPFFFPGSKVADRGMNLALHLHLMPRLRMNGAIPLYSPYILMADLIP